MSSSIQFDPRWLTSTVTDLARAIHQERAYDRCPILADALMDAGCDNHEYLSALRGPTAQLNDYSGSMAGHYWTTPGLPGQVVMGLADVYGGLAECVAGWHRSQKWAADRAELAAKAEIERLKIESYHRMATMDTVEDLRAKAKDAHAERRVSAAYWAESFAGLLEANIGYVKVEFHDLRGTPPAGTIWVRPSSSGKYARSRKEKKGPPLKAEHYATLLESEMVQ